MMMMMTNGSVYIPLALALEKIQDSRKKGVLGWETYSLSAFTQAQAQTKTVQKVEISVSHELWCNSNIYKFYFKLFNLNSTDSTIN